MIKEKNGMRKSIMIIGSFLLGMVLLITVCLWMKNAVFLISPLFRGQPRDQWKEQTSPLTVAQVKLLCLNFDPDPDGKDLCSGRPVYGPEFYPVIIHAFKPQEEFSPYGIGPEPATFDFVESKLSSFKTDCYYDLGNQSGFRYYKCIYDLRGDRKFLLGIFFNGKDNTVFRITRPMNPND